MSGASQLQVEVFRKDGYGTSSRKAKYISKTVVLTILFQLLAPPKSLYRTVICNK
ncbi:hypothetical protein ACS127_17855 [Amphibacillus sp. Q70]|uniref:hypothetical protein n=1 Tax=Amphibacillus sp. Q70 TaxID=3453416 RepID=UPI003F8395E8